ncbi:MAG: carboxylesterase [Chromatiales bacterium]
MDDEQTVIIEPAGQADKLVIWLHGLGADGHDFVPIVDELELGPLKVRFVFPHAPVLSVSINGGMQMRAWYDIVHPDLTVRIDAAGILASVESVAHLIAEQQAAGMQLDNIVLAGFSQGGVIALQTALQLDLPVAGVMALSCYLPLREGFDNKQKQNIFLAHGVDDGVVPYTEALSSLDYLRSNGHKVDWHSYPMMHSVCAEEIADISDWLQQVLA